ncbi:dicarboxylate/amino acid:cation symporter [soil metagenome]
MSMTTRILIALGLGLAAGVLLSSTAPTTLGSSLLVAKTIGALWLDSLRMTIVPLIFVLVVTGVGQTVGAATAGGVTGRTLLLFAGLLLVAAVFGVILMDLILTVFPIPQEAGAAMRARIAASGVQAPPPPPAEQWVRGVIPTNPITAAANGAIAPLVVFSLAFGFAATRITPTPRARLLEGLDAVLQTLLTIVDWVLKAAPVGVFALAFVAAAQTGIGAAGALVHYVATSSLFCVVLIIALYPLAALGGGLSPIRFARAAAPAQAVAFSTQSSIATLPAMLKAAKTLGGPESVPKVVLPLAVSLFRLGSAASGGAIALYVAKLSGMTLDPLQMAIAAGLSAVVSIAAVGLPSQVSFVTLLSPICLAVGAPLEALVLLMAVDTLPDAFRTVANVTADLAATAISGRWERDGGLGSEVGEQVARGAIVDTAEPLAEPFKD